MSRQEDRRPTHVYVGTAPCGCVQALASYHHGMREHSAKVVAEMIKDGLIVSSMTWEEYKAGPSLFMDCTHGKIVDSDTMQPPLTLPEG